MEITSEILKANFGRATGIGWYDIYMVRIDEYDENNFPTKFIAIRDAYRYPTKERFAVIQDDEENVIGEVKYVHQLQHILLTLGVNIDITIPEAMVNYNSKLKQLGQEANDLNWKMYDELVIFVEKHGGLIRTDNYERKKKCANIYVISMDGDDTLNTEKRVMAVALFETGLAVLPELSFVETIKGMTDQEVLDCDNWEWIYGGYVQQNATLYNLCEAIEQYV